MKAIKPTVKFFLSIFSLLAWATFCFAQKGNLPRNLSQSLAPEKVIGKASATFFRKRNQITVQVMPLQVYGDLNNGIVMVPNYISWGKKIIAPKWIDLEFISYSEKGPLFLHDRQLLIYLEDKILYSGRLKLSLLKRSSGTPTTEVISQRIPYSQFVQLTDGAGVKIKIGKIEFTLTQEHLESLRDLIRITDAAISFQ